MEHKKKLLIVAENNTAEKDFLESDFLGLAKEAFKEVIILAPEAKITEYQKLYGEGNIVIDAIKEVLNTFFQDKFFNILRYSIYAKTSRLRLVRTIFKHNGFQFNSWILFIWPCLFSWYLSGFKLWRRFLRWLYALGGSDKHCLAILKKYSPDIIYCDFTPISVKDFNLKLLKSAKKLGITTIGNIVSWDQLTSKTFITQQTDFLTVHNEKIKHEAIKYGDFRPEAIEITGIPRFDFYFKNDLYEKKEDFFQKIGADPSKKLVLFAGGLREFQIDYDYFFSLFEKFTKEKLVNLQFYLRPYPELSFPIELKEKYANSSNLVFEKETTDPEKLLANLFRHADVLICIYSTLMIEACLMDLPIINLSYFPNTQYKRYYEPERQLEKNHLADIFKENCCSMAKNDEELLGFIKNYLESPIADGLARKKTAQQQLSFNDGKSAERVFRAIEKIAKLS